MRGWYLVLPGVRRRSGSSGEKSHNPVFSGTDLRHRWLTFWKDPCILKCGRGTNVPRPHAPMYRRIPGQEGLMVSLRKRYRSKADLAPVWWRRVDSNHRSETQQIYSLPPLATRELLHMQLSGPPAAVGAGGRIRTPDLLITNQLLYRLSYTST